MLIGGEHDRVVIDEWPLKELSCEQRVVAETYAPYIETVRARRKTPMNLHHLLREIQKRLPPVRKPKQLESGVQKLSLEQVAQNILDNTRKRLKLRF